MVAFTESRSIIEDGSGKKALGESVSAYAESRAKSKSDASFDGGRVWISSSSRGWFSSDIFEMAGFGALLRG